MVIFHSIRYREYQQYPSKANYKGDWKGVELNLREFKM